MTRTVTQSTTSTTAPAPSGDYWVLLAPILIFSIPVLMIYLPNLFRKIQNAMLCNSDPNGKTDDLNYTDNPQRSFV